MPPTDFVDFDNDHYVSEEDSDFTPDKPGINDQGDSDSEIGDLHGACSTNFKGSPIEDGKFHYSSDESTIEKGKNHQRRRKATEDDDVNIAACGGDDERLIQTRAMKAVKKTHYRDFNLTDERPVTIDVDALWQSMVAGPIIPSSSSTLAAPSAPLKSATQYQDGDSATNGALPTEKATAGDLGNVDDEEMITITHSYVFAGKQHTETKRVPRNSAEAKVFLATHPEVVVDSGSNTSPPRRIRRAFRSRFEPIDITLLPPSVALGAATASVSASGLKRSDLNFGVANLLRMREEQQQRAAAIKLNTVQKSKLDWAQHVDAEGMREELEQAGKRKGNFQDRSAFLMRVEGRENDNLRGLRLKDKDRSRPG